MEQKASDVGWQLVRAEDALSDYRRVINRQISERMRRLERHRRQIVAAEIAGQLEINGVESLKLSPELQEIIDDPTGNIG